MYLMNLTYPFVEDFESGMHNWLATGTLTDSTFRSAIYSLNFSTDSQYVPYTESVAVLAHTMDLTESISPVLTFWHKADVPDAGDYVRVYISDNAGDSWTDIWSFTWDTITTWKYEQIDLSGYKAPNVKIMFQLRADEDSSVGEGWYVDDVEIKEL